MTKAMVLSLAPGSVLLIGASCMLPCVNAYLDPSTETVGARHLQGLKPLSVGLHRHRMATQQDRSPLRLPASARLGRFA